MSTGLAADDVALEREHSRGMKGGMRRPLLLDLGYQQWTIPIRDYC